MNAESPRRNAAIVGATVAVVMSIILCLFAIEEYYYHPKKLSDFTKTDLKQREDPRSALRDRYTEWTVEQNMRAFEWHERSTKIIFWVSMLITVTGISFAFWQFVEASRNSQAADRADQLAIKTQFISLAFRSRSLATFMMFVAIAYLLIYVTLVYPVTVVEGPKSVLQNLDPPTNLTPSTSVSGGPKVPEPPGDRK